jgi:hypothetical protein
MQSNGHNEVFLETLAKILIRSFFLGLAFLLLWFVSYLIAPDWIFQMNARWFNIGRRDFELINYFGMGFLKIIILLFFLIPYLAIESILRKRKQSHPINGD